MSTLHRNILPLILGLACAIVLAGCIKNPDAPTTQHATTASGTAGNVGEAPAPPPAKPASQTPASVRATPAAALAAFAEIYINWSYRTLTARQRTLATMSVGAARLAEQQAAATSATDSTIGRGQVWNHGQIIGIAPARTQRDMWVLVTREQTGGNSDYQGLPATYHVTLAQLAPVPGGYAVTQWLPQS